MNRFWNWTMKPICNATGDDAEDVRTLELYGAIASESWWDDDITPEMFREDLNSGTGPIQVYINSPGGDVFAASQIYTMLAEYPFNVTVKIDGIAASAASVVAMAGDTVLMAPTALLMIHNPSTIAMGDKTDLEGVIKTLDEVKESIINAYEIKTGLRRAKLSQMMDDETWMNAKKAVELRFADGLIGDNSDDGQTAYGFATNSVQRSFVAQWNAKNPIPTTNASGDDAEDGQSPNPESGASGFEPAPSEPETPDVNPEDETGTYETPEAVVAEPTVSEATPESEIVTGRNTDELRDRLDLIKKFI